MTAVTPEREEGLNPEDAFFEVFESYRPAPSPATDEVVGVLRAMTACAVDYLASGDATAKAIKEGIWGEKVQEARSLLAKLEVRG